MSAQSSSPSAKPDAERPASELTFIPSNIGKRELVAHDGFLYSISRKQPLTCYCICVKRDLGCKARLIYYKSRGTYSVTGVHSSHLPDHELIRTKLAISHAKTLMVEHPDLSLKECVSQLELEDVIQDTTAGNSSLKKKLAHMRVRVRAKLRDKAVYKEKRKRTGGTSSTATISRQASHSEGASGRERATVKTEVVHDYAPSFYGSDIDDNDSLATPTYGSVSDIRSDGQKSLSTVMEALTSWLRPNEFGEPTDNFGLVVGSGRYSKAKKSVRKILLCIDLKPVVLEEAIAKEADLIVTYRPLITSAVRSVAYNSWREELVARCIAFDVAVFSTHSTIANIPGGINDRICEAFAKNRSSPVRISSIIHSNVKPNHLITYKSLIHQAVNFKERVASRSLPDLIVNVAVDDTSTVTSTLYGPQDNLEVIKETAKENGLQISESEFVQFGKGRIIEFQNSQDLNHCIDQLKSHLNLEYVQTAFGGRDSIRKIAVHVGSNASTVLKSVAAEVDLIITGEMAHDDTLDCIFAGASVILCNKCSSERHILPNLACAIKVVTGVEEVCISEEDINPLHLIV